MYDCLRANKSLAAWGVEGRVPFLDKEFLMWPCVLIRKQKWPKMEKWKNGPLRKAFEDILPESVAWRQKEQFSDGVGYGWIDTLKQIAKEQVTDEMMANAKYRFPVHTPMNKEEYMYRAIYSEHFPSDEAAACVPSLASIACSTEAALAWDASFQGNADPSGRAVKTVHEQSKDFEDIKK